MLLHSCRQADQRRLYEQRNIHFDKQNYNITMCEISMLKNMGSSSNDRHSKAAVKLRPGASQPKNKSSKLLSV